MYNKDFKDRHVIFTKKILINNPISFITNLHNLGDTYLLDIIKLIYVDLNLNNGHIISVNKIIGRNPIFMESSSNIGSGTMSVTFETTVRYLKNGDIIPNCKILHVDNISLYCEYDNYELTVTRKNTNKIYKKNDFIDIEIISVDQLQNLKKTEIIGKIYEKHSTGRVYEIYKKDEVDMKEIDFFKNYINEHSSFVKTKSKGIDIFDFDKYPKYIKYDNIANKRTLDKLDKYVGETIKKPLSVVAFEVVRKLCNNIEFELSRGKKKIDKEK